MSLAVLVAVVFLVIAVGLSSAWFGFLFGRACGYEAGWEEREEYL